MDRNKSGAEHTAKGIVSQVKGNLKEAWGNLTDNPKAKLEGKVDQVKGRLQEDYGRLKSSIEDDDTLPL